MAQQTVVTKSDDLDPDVNTGVDTYQLGYVDSDGVPHWIEIDLGADNGERFINFVNAHVGAGRAVETPEPPARRAKGRRANSEEAALIQRIREWAIGQGLTVSSRGRLSQEVKDAYTEAHPDEV